MTMRARTTDGLHAPSKKPMYHPSTHVAVDEPAEEADESGELNLSMREDSYGLHSGGDVMADMDMDADE